MSFLFCSEGKAPRDSKKKHRKCKGISDVLANITEMSHYQFAGEVSFFLEVAKSAEPINYKVQVWASERANVVHGICYS